MQAPLARDVTSGFLRNVRRRLVHDHHQVTLGMVLQHLPQELHDLLRSDPLAEQLKYQASLSTQSRHGRYPAAFARDCNVSGLAAEFPCLSKKRGQRYVRLVLEVQNCPEFLDGSANARRFGPQPFFPCFLVQLKVSAFGLLIRKARIPQAPPHRVFGERDSILLANHLSQPTDSPQVRFKAEMRGWFQYHIIEGLHVKGTQQAWPTASRATLQAPTPLRDKSAHPTKQCRPIHPVGVGNLTYRLATLHRKHGTGPRVKRRVPSLAHAQVRIKPLALRQGQRLQFLCGEPYFAISPTSDNLIVGTNRLWERAGPAGDRGWVRLSDPLAGGSLVSALA